jgi:hypothetical protein
MFKRFACENFWTQSYFVLAVGLDQFVVTMDVELESKNMSSMHNSSSENKANRHKYAPLWG